MNVQKCPEEFNLRNVYINALFSQRGLNFFFFFPFSFVFAREYIVSVFPLMFSSPTNGRYLGLLQDYFFSSPFSGF